METRSRGKRQRNADATTDGPVKRRRGAPPGRRRAQPSRNVADSQNHYDASVAGSRGSQDDSSDAENARMKASRRGAPRDVDSESVISVRTAKPQDSGDDVESGENDEGGEDGEDGEDAKRQVMHMTLPDLSHAADKLLRQLRAPERGHAVYYPLLKVKRNAFLATREAYEEPAGFPFIDETWLGGLSDRPQRDVMTLGSANLASALDIIERIQVENEPEVLERLAELDDFTHKLFAPFGDAAENLALALDLRTVRAVETLAAQKTKPNFQLILAPLFCDLPDEARIGDYPHLLTHGPPRPLSCRTDDDVAQEWSDRIDELINATRGVKKADLAKALRATWPLQRTIQDLREWICHIYDSYTSAPLIEAVEDFHDAREQPTGDDSESYVESQPIQRDTGPQYESHFKGADSLRHLAEVGQPPAPPSNQQQIRLAGQDIPEDYSHGNVFVLGSRPSSIIEASQDAGGPSNGTGGRETRIPGQVDEGDEDEDDPFQEDERPVDHGRSAAISHALEASRPAATMEPSSSPMPPPPRPTASANFEAIEHEKRLLSRQYRATGGPARAAPSPTPPPSFRQRHTWSSADANLLIQLISEYHASWALIESNCGSLFEQKRNQQAFRDKARNMKVDFLLTNVTLPPYFDQVTLGKKEIDRLVRMGKNPWRKEKDVDENGNAINTEYMGHGQLVSSAQ